MTIERTSDSGKCVGCAVPGAAFWFLKYICVMGDNRRGGSKSEKGRFADCQRGHVWGVGGGTDLVVQEWLDKGLGCTGRSAGFTFI